MYLDKKEGPDRSVVTGMFQPSLKEFVDVFVVQSVKDVFAFTPAAYQSHLPQQAELVGHSRSAHAQARGQVTHAQLGV